MVLGSLAHAGAMFLPSFSSPLIDTPAVSPKAVNRRKDLQFRIAHCMIIYAKYCVVLLNWLNHTVQIVLVDPCDRNNIWAWKLKIWKRLSNVASHWWAKPKHKEPPRKQAAPLSQPGLYRGLLVERESAARPDPPDSCLPAWPRLGSHSHQWHIPAPLTSPLFAFLPEWNRFSGVWPDVSQLDSFTERRSHLSECSLR